MHRGTRADSPRQGASLHLRLIRCDLSGRRRRTSARTNCPRMSTEAGRTRRFSQGQISGIVIATNYDILSTTSQGANVPPYWSKMCMAGIEAACISAEGELRACIVAAGIGVAGSLLESKLYELWHDDERWGIFRNVDRRVLEQCRKCPDYTVKCPGSCIAMTEFSKSPEEMYCFKHLVR